MKVMIIDDHPIVRRGITAILENEDDISVCCEAEDAESAMRLIGENPPDVAIVDIELKGGVNGIQLIRQIRSTYSSVLCLVMSMDDGSLYSQRAIRAGARGYVAKEEAAEKIVSAIRTVLRGDIYLSADLAERIASGSFGDANGLVDVTLLSNKEFEIFQLIGRGFKRSEISKETGMNINTIESHRRKIREKLSLGNSAELSRVAVHWHASKNQHD